MNKPASNPLNVRMMRGTYKNLDYMAFARKGDILLGIKPNIIADGEPMGFPNTTHIGARLRSAVNKELAAELDEAGVLKTQQKDWPDSPATAWDGIEWEKKCDSYASTQIGVFIRGTLKTNPHLLKEQFENGKLAKKMADYMVDLAGHENLICSISEIEGWLQNWFKPIIIKIDKSLAISAAVVNEVESNIGVFGMQAAILKKVHSKLAEAEHAHSAPDADEDDEDDDQD